MNRAFLFIETDCVVEPALNDHMSATLDTIMAREVVVKTPDMVGSGVILGDAIITSLFLVANFSIVDITFQGSKKMPAFVTSRDQRRNLAKLRPTELETTGSLFDLLLKKLAAQKLTPAGPRAIGEALLVANSRSGVPKVKVAGMCYGMRVSERWENNWRIDSTAPRGLMGSGVWDDDGRFVGVSLASRIPLGERATKSVELVYGAPASEVLDFTETK